MQMWCLFRTFPEISNNEVRHSYVSVEDDQHLEISEQYIQKDTFRIQSYMYISIKNDTRFNI